MKGRRKAKRETVSDVEIVEPHDGGDELERLRVAIEEQKETISALEEQNEAIHNLEYRLSEANSAITTLTETHEKELEYLQVKIAREKQR